MNTTERYINNWSEFDSLQFPKTRFREIRTEVHRSGKQYLSRIIKLNEKGRVESEIRGGGWKAYPPGQTPHAPELNIVDQYSYSEEDQTVVVNTVNMDDHRAVSHKTIQYNDKLIQTMMFEIYYDGLTNKTVWHYKYDTRNKIMEILSSTHNNGICYTKNSTIFVFNEKHQIIQKEDVHYGKNNENKTPIFSMRTNYDFNSRKQLKTAYLSTEAESISKKITTKFQYLNQKDDLISKIYTFESDKLNKTFLFEYDEHQELIRKTIDEKGKENIVLNYIGIL